MKLGELQKLTQMMPALQGPQLQQWLQEHLAQIGLDPNAIYQELEMTSPYVDTHRDSSYSNSHVQLHSHTFYEVLYCTNSCGAEYLVGSQRYRLQQGDIIFVPPGVSHRPLLPQDMQEPYKRYVLWLSLEFMAQFASLYPSALTEQNAGASMLRTLDTPWEYLGELFRAGVREAEQQSAGWEAAIIGNTMQLLTQIARASEGQTVPLAAEQPELLDQIATYVENHYSQPIAIDALARRFFVSSSTISHLVKHKLGVSFHRYLAQRRLIAAKSLIEQGLRLDDVARMTGFSDYSSFFRSFRKEYGISPRQYRTLQDG